jgi:hypothetical protein
MIFTFEVNGACDNTCQSCDGNNPGDCTVCKTGKNRIADPNPLTPKGFCYCLPG